MRVCILETFRVMFALNSDIVLHVNYISILIDMHVCINIYIYIFVYVCLYICVYIYQ